MCSYSIMNENSCFRMATQLNCGQMAIRWLRNPVSLWVLLLKEDTVFRLYPWCHPWCQSLNIMNEVAHTVTQVVKEFFFHLHVIFQCDDRHSFSLKINNCGFKAIRGVPACLTDVKQHQQKQSARSRPSFRFTLVMNNPVNAARGRSNSLETGMGTSTSDLRQPWLTDKTPSIWDF